MTTDVGIRREAERASTEVLYSGTTSWAVALGACDPLSLWKPITVQTVAAATTPKLTEANRQISRLSDARTFAESRSDDGDDLEGLATCMALISQFASAPFPIPVAGWTAGEGPSLFLKTDDFYGDLEVEGNEVEYYIKWLVDGVEKETFGVEEATDGRLPPKLLGVFYSAFARQNANLR